MPSAVELWRYTGSIGPVKVEFILLDSPNSSETIQTRLANPKGVGVFTGQTTGQIINPSASLSGKTVTLGTNDGTADLIVIVIGF